MSILIRSKGIREIFLNARPDDFRDFIWLTGADAYKTDLSTITDIFIGTGTYETPPAEWETFSVEFDEIQFPEDGEFRIGYRVGADDVADCHNIDGSPEGITHEMWVAFGTLDDMIPFRCGKVIVHK